MNFVYKREYLHAGDIVLITCDYACNAHLVTDINFEAYKAERQYEFYGGAYRRFPARLQVPFTGYWNITIDVGTSANFRCGINVISA